jgi:hypothetical protein
MPRKWSEFFASLPPERREAIEIGVARATKEMVERRTSCGECADGWRCAVHPDDAAGHDGCGGDWIPCCHPSCPPFTGIACTDCKRPVAVIAHQTSTLVVFSCVACGHVWHWDDTPSQIQH